MDAYYKNIEVFLPSRGLVYPKDHPASTGRLHLKPMTAQEEDILSSRTLIKQGLVLDKLLESCILTPGVNPLTLLSGDRSVLFVVLRISGFGTDYIVDITCPGCGRTSRVNIDLGIFAEKVKFLETQPIEEGTNKFRFKFPRTEIMVTFKLMTGEDELALFKQSEESLLQQERLSKQSYGKLVQSTIEREVTSRMERTILSMEIKGKEVPAEEIPLIIKSIPAADSRDFRRYIREIEPGIDTTYDFECRFCGLTNTMDIPITTEFFWPTV